MTDPVRPDGGDHPSFLETAPQPVLAYDGGGEATVRWVNHAFEAAFELDAETAVDEPVSTVLPGAETDDPEAVEPTAGLLDAIRADEANVVIDRNGARHFQVSDVPTDGDGPGGYLLFTDVTDHRRTIADLEAAVERLEQSTQIVAHDIRNPLEVAAINLDVARETGDEALLEEVARAHDDIERLIEDVLTLAGEGQVIDDRAAADLEAVVRQAWANVRTDDAALAVDGSITVQADADRLQQLLENLFRNAVTHGGREVRVLAGSLPDERGFYVEDDGPGIPTAERDRVFEYGYSPDGGSGLGLAIVERIAEAHGWSVRVVDGRDGGARFEFTVEPE